MRLALLIILLLFQRTAVLAAEPTELTAEEKRGGFELLFNGIDLTGWEHAGNWKVEDSVITRSGKGGSLLYTVKPLPDNFELRFEWKVAAGSNSGVYYRPGQYEYQILDNAAHRDGQNPRTSAASLYFGIAPSHDATKPVGQWNEGRIVCKNTVIQHWLNGEPVVDIDYADAKWTKDIELLKRRGGDVTARGSLLSLQDHGDPVWYRAFRLRAIPAAESIQASPAFRPAPIPPEMLEREQEYFEKKQKAAKKKQS